MKNTYLEFGVFVYLWIALLVVGVLTGCGDNELPDEPLPQVQPCVIFETFMLADEPDVEAPVPSLTPAPFGTRIIVDHDFQSFMGSSAQVPGGRLAWVVWVYHWYDGDHLGAIGRVGDTVACRWYEPL